MIIGRAGRLLNAHLVKGTPTAALRIGNAPDNITD